MTDQFKREERYTVIKNKTGKPVECVVVEKDWPEYEIVWRMIQDRVEGRPNALAESQARIKVLEDALNEVVESGLLYGSYTIHDETRSVAHEALSTTSPTEALDKVVLEAKEEMCERCAVLCDSMHDERNGDCAEAIRRIAL